jgi:uncharacterized protein (TIGR00299 family) protein
MRPPGAVKALYFDCFSGASGDMVLGALLDAGVPEDAIRASLHALKVEGWSLEIAATTRGGIRATKATVAVQEEGAERTYEDIVTMVGGSYLTARVKALSLEVFEVLARAEAKVHGVDVGTVHFHEVGSLDAIIDVVGSCAALAHLDPDVVVGSAIATGSGLVGTAHGLLPLPAPAVAEMLAARGAAVVGRGTRELVTPTGAALLTTWSHSFGDLPPMQIDAVGYGAGAAEDEVPNLLRVFVGHMQLDSDPGSNALVVETNVDDMSPELFPYVIERLIDCGAQDAWVTPIVMKKGRPAHTISVLVEPGRRAAVMETLFHETSTLGVRTTTVTKHAVEREWITVEVGGLQVRVKLGRTGGKVVTMAPEYEDAAGVARATGLPLKEVYARAIDAARLRSPAP